MAEQGQQSEDQYVKRVYKQIIALALAAHFSYIVIFSVLGLWTLTAYNVASFLFYCATQAAARRGYFRLTVSSIHVEVCFFVCATTLTAGWGIGMALYLVAMTSLVYFCPFEHKYVPYLFAVLEICIFVSLKLYTGLIRPNYLAVSESTGLWLYMYNACACFVIILYAAFSSKVSAAVSRKELQDENRNLSVLANYDQLTGLLNRHAFLNRLEKQMGGSMIIALSDIDDFKAINDTWGHVCGDQVLSESAELIRSRLGREVEICRWGGEEFVFLFRDMPLEEVVEKVQGLCDAVSGHIFHCEKGDIHVTMTFGVGSSAGEISLDELMELADERMYEGKARGKNQVVYMKI